MKVTATELRKNLFQLLDGVLHGKTLEVAYKGAALRVTPVAHPSKLARAKRQHALIVDPDEIVHSDRELNAKMASEWRKDWRNL